MFQLMPSSLYVCGCNNISRSTQTLIVDGCITCICRLTLLFLNMFDGKNYYMRRSHETYVLVTCKFYMCGTYKLLRHWSYATISYNTFSELFYFTILKIILSIISYYFNTPNILSFIYFIYSLKY